MPEILPVKRWLQYIFSASRLFIGFLICLQTFSMPSLVAAAPVTLNLKNADIGALIESVSLITGRNFIVDPRVKGRVTVVSSKPMDESEIYEVFLSVLAVHGFSAVPSDRITKIVPAAGAKQENIPTLDRLTVEQDQVITRVIQVQNVSAAQIVPILRPLIPPQGHLAAYAPTNVLIVSDNAANVERIANIISRVDLASNEEVEVIRLRHASASDVVRTLTALEQAQGQRRTAAAAGAGAATRLVADERTNSVLMSGDASTRLRLRALISHLDTPLESGGNTQVIYLRYATAVDLVPVLQGVSQKLAEDQQQAGGRAARRQPGAAGGVAGNQDLDIQADESTNALVVTGSPEAIRNLRQVIAQLDIRRAQVLVEAAIAEISTNRSADLGVEWVVDGRDGGSAIGFINFGRLGSFLGVIQGDEDGALTSIPSSTGLTVGVGDLDSSVSFAAVINALISDVDSNVLSTPTLVTLDNQKARISVGENRPFLTGSFTTTADGANNPFQTIERRDVALTLEVTPQINEGNAVRLEILQTVENVVPGSVANPDGIVTNKREIETTVLVEDGQILVLGGLIDDNLSETIDKVPGLGDIPVLGHLFRSRGTDKIKRNLMVFLHPVILRDADLGSAYTNDKYSYIRQQQLAARLAEDQTLRTEVQTPLLKPLEQVEQERTLLNLEASGERQSSESPPISSSPPEPVDPPAAATAEAPYPADTQSWGERFNNR